MAEKFVAKTSEMQDGDRRIVFVGDNESGVTHGPGLGRLMADLVVDGDSAHGNTHRYRVERFATGAYPDEAAVRAGMPIRG